MTSWNRFISQFKKDVKQWLFFMGLLSVLRIVFVLSFGAKIEHGTSWPDIVKAFLNGLRYDGTVATYMILISVLTSVLCGFIDIRNLSDRVRFFLGSTFTVLTVTLSVIAIGYFREFNDQFNHWIFNLYYDDTKAIFSTIWAEYHVIPNLLAVSVASAVFLKLRSLFMKTAWLNGGPDPRPLPFFVRVVYGFVIAALLTVGARGSYGHRPVKLEDAAVTRDSFLNKAVINPYSALLYAYSAHRKIFYTSKRLETYLPDGDVRRAAQELSGNRGTFSDLDQYLKRVAPGHRNKQAKHIFLVVMESYDAWPLIEKYASLGLTRELAALAQKGIHVKAFLPASDGTATSLSALITGLPDVNVVTNYRKTSQTAYPSSIAESFKRLGYRTRFFYGGYLSWQKTADFVKAQGFDEVYGGSHIGTWASHNEWGAEDESLFDFIVATVGSASDKPSLNVIMTTSYHPPYELDVYGKGFRLREVPADLAAQFDGSVSLKILGHLWYSDRCLGDFVRSAEQKFSDALFAFTGDHYSRKFINTHPDEFEASAVPFILYGKDVLRGVSVPDRAVGSHLDIGPTLIELSAPKGFSYYAVGRNIFGPERNQFGIGRDKVIGKDFLYEVTSGKFFPLPDRPLPKLLPDPKQLKLLHDRKSGIAWWRIMRGEKL